jgi:hypothetical protein
MAETNIVQEVLPNQWAVMMVAAGGACFRRMALDLQTRFYESSRLRQDDDIKPFVNWWLKGCRK